MGKRAASTSGGGARFAKKCKALEPTIKAADSLPEPVRAILAGRLVNVFGTYKADRHVFQNTVSKLVADTLKTTQANLQAAINDAQAKKAAKDGECANVTAASNNANAASDAAAAASAASKQALTDCQTALRDAKQSLQDQETAVKDADQGTSDTEARKLKLEGLENEFFKPVSGGTLDKGLVKSAAWAGKLLGKEFSSHLEHEFLVCVVRSFSKPASAWGTFDHIVNTQLDKDLQKVKAALANELSTLAGAKNTATANVENAKAAVAHTTSAVENANAANTAAADAAKVAKKAAQAAVAAAKQNQPSLDKAARTLADAEEALTEFKDGPLAAYTEVEAHLAPPPKPEAPAAEAPAETGLAQAMTAAPANAAAAPRVLPSPGVLFMQAARGVASTVGSLSPRLAPSPRAN